MLVVANQQRSALRQPGQGSLYYPATRFASAWPALSPTVITDRPDVGYVAMPLGYLVAGGIIVSFVETEVLLKPFRVGAFDDDRLDRRIEQFLIDDIGSGDDDPKWSPVTLDQERLLGAVLGAVSGVFPHIFSTKSSFAQSTICGLPSPVDRSELFAFFEQDGPDSLEDAVTAPPLEPAMNRAIIAEMPREFCSTDIQSGDGKWRRSSPTASLSEVDRHAPWVLPEHPPEDRLDPPPKVVVDFPNCIKRLFLSEGPSHPCFS